MKYKTVFFFMLFASVTFAQQDEAAEKILDKLAQQNKSNKTIIASFTVEYKNLQSEHPNSSKGKITMKGEKYKLDIRNSVVYFNGKTMWNYLKESNEVNISEPVEDTDKQDILNHPNKIFEIYKKDFKYKYMGETTQENKQLYAIDLYPKNLEKDYSRIKIKVNQENYHIHSAKIYGKDGSRINFIINQMQTNQPVPDSTFVFDKSEYPDVEIIDMRF